MLLDRQGARAWLASRLVRLGVPLLFATLLILAVPDRGPVRRAHRDRRPAQWPSCRATSPWSSAISASPGSRICGSFGADRLLRRPGGGSCADRRRGPARPGQTASSPGSATTRILSLSAFAAICETRGPGPRWRSPAPAPITATRWINYNLYAPVLRPRRGAVLQPHLAGSSARTGVPGFAAGVALVILSQACAHGAHHPHAHDNGRADRPRS